MDYEKPRTLFRIVMNSKPLRAGHFEPRPPVVNASYLNRHTVEPLDFKVVNDCEYWVRIAPYNAEGRTYPALVISLFERELNGRRKSSISVKMPFTAEWDVIWVKTAAVLLAEKYRGSDCTFRDSPPEKEVLVQLIAGRVLYYKDGGSAQNKRD